MARLVVLTNIHAGANGVQYTKALRSLGHDVLLVGPRFTEQDASRWRDGLMAMEWAPTSQDADEYVHRVLTESPEPDIVTQKGKIIQVGHAAWVKGLDAVISFFAYKEEPCLDWVVTDHPPRALVIGDSHTAGGELLGLMRYRATAADHLFLQFRRSDLAAFDHPIKHWLPAAADPEIWHPYPEVAKDIDVLFVGSTHPQIHRDRVELIRYLQANGINVTVRHAFGSDAARLMARAKVVIHRSLAGDLAMRVPEALACGAALVTDNVDGLADVFGGHYMGYASPAGSLAHIRMVLGAYAVNDPPRNERFDREHVLVGHTYEHRARQILTTLGLPEEGDGLLSDTRDTAGVASGSDPSRVTSAGLSSDRSAHRLGETGEGPGAQRRSLAEVAVVTGREDRRGDERAGSLRRNAGEEKLTASIIIPAYNHWQDCTELLLKCFARDVTGDQALAGAEVIVVDDGSTDETATYSDKVNCYGWREFKVLHKSNGGFASACNYGALHAKGQYLVFLNNDTQPQEGWLQPLVDELIAGGGIVGARMLDPHAPGDHLVGGYATQSAGLAQSTDGTWSNLNYVQSATDPYEVTAVTGACLGIQRDLFLQLGSFDEGYRQGGCEDVDLCLRVRREGERVMVCPASMVLHYEGSTRFALPDVQERIRENQARLFERWEHVSNSGGSLGHTADASAGPGGGPTSRQSDAVLGRVHTADRVSRVPHASLIEGPLDVRNGDADPSRSDGADRGDLPRSVHDASAGGVAQPGQPQRPLTLTIEWDGPTDSSFGSIGIINRELLAQLPQLGIDAQPERDHGVLPLVRVSHRWNPEGWTPPRDGVLHHCLIVPWEGHSPVPDAWKSAADHPKLREVWTPSEHSKRLLAPLFGAERITVIPNGVDISTFNPDGPRAEGRDDLWRCLFVGGLLYRKGVDLLYRAWELAFRPDDPVLLILKTQGKDTFYRGQFLDPPERVASQTSIIHREVDAVELAGIVRRCDVYAAPYRFEGFGMPILESMACGLPVVTPQHGPALEFVPDGAGIRVPSADAEVDVTALARALRYLYENREAGKVMGRVGAEAAKEYSWERVSQLYAEQIRRVCEC